MTQNRINIVRRKQTLRRVEKILYTKGQSWPLVEGIQFKCRHLIIIINWLPRSDDISKLRCGSPLWNKSGSANKRLRNRKRKLRHRQLTTTSSTRRPTEPSSWAEVTSSRRPSRGLNRHRGVTRYKKMTSSRLVTSSAPLPPPTPHRRH